MISHCCHYDLQIYRWNNTTSTADRHNALYYSIYSIALLFVLLITKAKKCNSFFLLPKTKHENSNFVHEPNTFQVKLKKKYWKKLFAKRCVCMTNVHKHQNSKYGKMVLKWRQQLMQTNIITKESIFWIFAFLRDRSNWVQLEHIWLRMQYTYFF